MKKDSAQDQNKLNRSPLTRNAYRGYQDNYIGTDSATAPLNTVYLCNCNVFGLRSYDEPSNLKRSQFLDEKGRVYIEYTDFGNKTNRGSLRDMKVS